jgi:hypothetical protein
MNGYINLPMKISHSDDDSGLPVSGESMWGADRVIELDDESSEKTSAAQTTWEVTWLASELPNEVGQQQGCSQPTGFQTWTSEYLKRRKDQEHESTRETSKAACLLQETPATITCGGATETCFEAEENSFMRNFPLGNACLWEQKEKLEMVTAPRGAGSWAGPNLSWLAAHSMRSIANHDSC